MVYNSLFPEGSFNYLKEEVFREDFPEMLAINGVIMPLDFSAGPLAEYITFQLLTQQGTAAVFANCGHDLPAVNAFMTTRRAEIYRVGDQFSYCEDTLAKSISLGMNLDTSLGLVAREIVERQMDLIGLRGYEGLELYGLYNQPNATAYIVPADGSGGSTLFADKTPTQIYRDLTNFLNSISEATLDIFRPDELHLPVQEYNIINTQFFDGTAMTTIREQLERIYPGLIVRSVPILAQLGVGGVPRMFAYMRRHFAFNIPQMPVFKRPEYCRMTWTIPVVGKVSSVTTMKPMAQVFADFT